MLKSARPAQPQARLGLAVLLAALLVIANVAVLGVSVGACGEGQGAPSSAGGLCDRPAWFSYLLLLGPPAVLLAAGFGGASRRLLYGLAGGLGALAVAMFVAFSLQA